MLPHYNNFIREDPKVVAAFLKLNIENDTIDVKVIEERFVFSIDFEWNEQRFFYKKKLNHFEVKFEQNKFSYVGVSTPLSLK